MALPALEVMVPANHAQQVGGDGTTRRQEPAARVLPAYRSGEEQSGTFN
jgi:hypothetical protein